MDMNKPKLFLEIERFEKWIDSLYLDSEPHLEIGLQLLNEISDVEDDFKQQMWSRIPPLLNHFSTFSNHSFDRHWVRVLWNRFFSTFELKSHSSLLGFWIKNSTFQIDLNQITLTHRLLTFLQSASSSPTHINFSFKLLWALNQWGVEVRSDQTSKYALRYTRWKQDFFKKELKRTAYALGVIESSLRSPLKLTNHPQLGWDFELLVFTWLNAPWLRSPWINALESFIHLEDQERISNTFEGIHSIKIDFAPLERDILGGGDLSIRFKKDQKMYKGWLQVSLSAEQDLNDVKKKSAQKKGCFWVLSPWTLAQRCSPQHPFWTTQSHCPATLQGRAYAFRDLFIKSMKTASSSPLGPLTSLPFLLGQHLITQVFIELLNHPPLKPMSLPKLSRVDWPISLTQNEQMHK